MLLLSVLCLLMVNLQTSGHVNEKYLVCKPVSSVFSSDDETQNQTRRSTKDCNAAARPGKRGIRGFQGLPGPIGPPGVVDYETLNEQLRGELREIKRQLSCQDGVVVGEICYQLPFRVGVRLNYDQARDLCIFHAGLLAEIPTEEVYNAVFNYVKRSWNIDLDNQQLNYVQVWLDSVYQNGNVILRNGQHGYANWYPSYPSESSSSNRIALNVHIKPDRIMTDTGMFNSAPSSLEIPLCQFTLE